MIPQQAGASDRQRGEAGVLIFTALLSLRLLQHHTVTPLKYSHPTGKGQMRV